MVPGMTDLFAAAGAQLPKVSPRSRAGPCGLPTHEEIARRAYNIWVAAGRVHGADQEHWFQAERELMTSPFASRTPPR